MANFIVRTAANKVQFDDELVTYALKASGSAAVADRRVGNSSPRSVIIPGTSAFTGLIALGGPNGYTAALAGRWQGGDRVYASDAPTGTVWNYYLFQLTTTIPSTGNLLIRNAANQVTFSSDQRIMNSQGRMFSGGSKTVPGKQLAFCQGTWAGNRFYSALRPSVGNPDLYDYTIVSKVYGGKLADGGQTVTTGQVSWGDATVRGGPEPPPEIDRELQMFVVDVTDITIGATFF